MPAAVGARHAAAQYLKVSAMHTCTWLEQCTASIMCPLGSGRSACAAAPPAVKCQLWEGAFEHDSGLVCWAFQAGKRAIYPQITICRRMKALSS